MAPAATAASANANSSSWPYLDKIECSDQPLDLSFHPRRDNLVAVALVDGTLEVHDLRRPTSSGNVGKEEDDNDDDDDDVDSILSSLSLHPQIVQERDAKGQATGKTKRASCKTTRFSYDGLSILSAGAAGDLCAVDAERACTFNSTQAAPYLWRIEAAAQDHHRHPIVTLHTFSSNGNSDSGNPFPYLFATGDDGGGVRVWDSRLCGNGTTTSSGNGAGAGGSRPRGCVRSWKHQEDYISGLDHSDDGNTLISASADGRLGVYDLRMSTCDNTKNKSSEKTSRLSDDQEDELLSVRIMKNGTKVVCGTGLGVLSVFSWGTWGDVSDRFPGHPSSIDALLKIDESCLLTGSSDGVMRVVQIQPDKLLGVIGGDHDGFPIKKLAFNSNRHVVGSVSHDSYVRLWNARALLDDDDEDEEDDDHQDGKDKKLPAAKRPPPSTLATTNGSDDEWEDMDKEAADEDEDDDSNDDDDDDSDDSDDNDSDDDDDDEDEDDDSGNRGRKRLKTENEKFFEDL